MGRKLNRSLTQDDVQTMLAWVEIYEAEVERVVRVLDHFEKNVLPQLKREKLAKQRGIVRTFSSRR
jgi:hypothetical protein